MTKKKRFLSFLSFFSRHKTVRDIYCHLFNQLCHYFKNFIFQKIMNNQGWRLLKVSSSIFRKGKKKSGPLPIPKKVPTSKPSSSDMAPKAATARSSKKSADNRSKISHQDKSRKWNESKTNTSTQQKVIGSVRLMPKKI